MNSFPNTLSDIVVIIKNKKTSKKMICNGYRPAFKVKDDYLTSGLIRLIGTNEVPYDGESMADVWLITPKFYPHCLEEGQIIQFQEGSLVQGYATIVKINNKQLAKIDD